MLQDAFGRQARTGAWAQICRDISRCCLFDYFDSFCRYLPRFLLQDNLGLFRNVSLEYVGILGPEIQYAQNSAE